MTENSDIVSGCEDMLSRPAKEKSESVLSLGGMSMSEDRSAEGVGSLSEKRPRASLTKHTRVLISSMRDSVRTSWGTRVDRLAAGMLTAALRVVGGGR